LVPAVESVIELPIFRVHFDFRELDFLDLKVKVTQPVVNVGLVLLLNTTEFV
jgi:hypothetical protein